MFLRPLSILLCTTTLLAGFVHAALADDDDDNDHELARRALAEGRILPLKEILKRLGAELPGQAIEVEFGEEDGRLEYEIKVLTPQGRVMEAEIDAATGRIIQIEEDD